jgi:hypothetical protein
MKYDMPETLKRQLDGRVKQQTTFLNFGLSVHDRL